MVSEDSRCTRDSALSGLSDLFTNPQHYATTLNDDLLWFGDRSVTIRRYADHIAFGLEQWGGDDRLHSQSLFVTVTESAAEHWQRVFADESELLHRCLRLSTYHKIHSVRHREYVISADIMIYTPPVGVALTECVDSDPDTALRIYRALDALEEQLRQCDCYFDIDDFAVEQMILAEECTLSPQSLSGVTLDGGSSPRQCCDALRQWVCERSGVKPPYRAPKRDLTPAVEPEQMFVEGHLWCGTPHEERIAVLDESGYGFVDMENRTVVASIYRSVTSFKEGRSVVESDRGYGLINVWGEFILDDTFDDMSYDESTGITTAKQNGAWSQYSYNGEPIKVPQ